MGRPKASHENLIVAAAFAHAITKRYEARRRKHVPLVDCKGPHSLFSALGRCMPDIVRNSSAESRNGVTEVELNKFLGRMGYASFRDRYRIRGTCRWTKSYLRWKNMRWINLSLHEEREHMRVALQDLRSQFPLFVFSEERLMEFMEEIKSIVRFPSTSSNSGSLEDSELDSSDEAELEPFDRFHALDMPILSATSSSSNSADSHEEDWEPEHTDRKDDNVTGVVVSSRHAPFQIPFSHITTHRRLRFNDQHYHSTLGCPDWALIQLHCHCQFGNSSESFISMFRHMPPDLFHALRDAFVATEAVRRHALQRAAAPSAALARHLPGGDSSQRQPWTIQSCGEDLELGIFDEAEFGVCRYTYDPDTHNRTEFYVNRGFCEQAGMSLLEMQARVGNQELPERQPQLDYLCQVVETVYLFVAERRAEHTQYIRQAWPGGDPALIERKTKACFSGDARRWGHVCMFRRATPAEYDAARAAGGEARLLMRALGDARPGAQLIAETAQDQRAHSIQALAASLRGRQTLARLAAAVRDLFAPTIRRAQAIRDAAAAAAGGGFIAGGGVNGCAGVQRGGGGGGGGGCNVAYGGAAGGGLNNGGGGGGGGGGDGWTCGVKTAAAGGGGYAAAQQRCNSTATALQQRGNEW